jgi:type VI secretion system secreted protein Hcp
MVKPLRPSALSRTLALVPPAIALVAQQASGAYDVFLKIGDIKGESVDEKHKDWIDASSFQFGIGVGVSRPSGGGAEVSKPTLSEIVVTKSLDRSSPALFIGCALGTRHSEVKLELKVPSLSAPFYRITLSNVIVSGVSNSGAAGSDSKPSESISLNFEKIKIEYFVQDPKGGIIETVAPVTWNVSNNSKE